MKRKNKRKGFTLIELVIVLAVIGIIMLIAIPNFMQVKKNSENKALDRSREQIEKIINIAYSSDIINDDTTEVIYNFESQEITATDTLSEDNKESLEVLFKNIKPLKKEYKTIKITAINKGDIEVNNITYEKE